jgi:DNA-directed RNA polymerase specialized sigma24 family protein
MQSTSTPATGSPLNPLIERYRRGDSSAAEELLTRFERYLAKWLRLLLYASWDPRDRELSHFLHLLGSVDLKSTAQILSRQLKAYEKEDLEQEVKVTLLDTALRCRSIRRQYRYILHHRVMQLIRDPLVFGGSHLPLLEEQLPGIPGTYNPDIDQNWVAGSTCGEGFAELTPREREILRLWKWHGHTIEQVAQMLGLSVATVNRAIARSKQVLRVYYLE